MSVSLALGVTLTGCSDGAEKAAGSDRSGQTCAATDPELNSPACNNERFLLAIVESDARGLNTVEPERLIEFGRRACAYAKVIETKPEFGTADYDSFRTSTAGLWGVEPGDVDTVVDAMTELCPSEAKALSGLRSGS